VYPNDFTGGSVESTPLGDTPSVFDRVDAYVSAPTPTTAIPIITT
jgi:hypothetical protein